MTHNTSNLMHQSDSLRARITAATAKANSITNPEQWVRDQLWFIITDPAWETAWEAALRQLDNTKFNPDTGSRDDIITDVMITDAVAAEIARLAALEPPV